VAERGVRSVTLADVVARAKVSPRTVREQFTDVEGALLAAFEWVTQRAGATMAEAYDGELRWIEAIRAALAAMLELVEQEPELARLWIVDSLGAGPTVLRSRARAIAVLCEYVDRGRLETASRSKPPGITAEGVVGALLAVLQARLLAPGSAPPRELQGELASLIVLPYMGSAAAKRELTRPVGRFSLGRASQPGQDGRSWQLGQDGRSAVTGLGWRLTYRTARVLSAIAERPGSNNREVGNRGEVVDQGQISKLLSRLEFEGLIVNSGGGRRGAPNAWELTPRGEQVERATSTRTRTPVPRRARA
jgi:AcrR family transcriptional regulator/DNA-binding MarR family transcriptional regulator